MLEKIIERRYELTFMLVSSLVLGTISIRNLMVAGYDSWLPKGMRNLFVSGESLNTLSQSRELKIQRLRATDIMLSAQIGALEAEIDVLKRDTEETSLVARTLLGMVSSDEVIYQLNHQRVEELR